MARVHGTNLNALFSKIIKNSVFIVWFKFDGNMLMLSICTRSFMIRLISRALSILAIIIVVVSPLTDVVVGGHGSRNANVFFKASLSSAFVKMADMLVHSSTLSVTYDGSFTTRDLAPHVLLYFYLTLVLIFFYDRLILLAQFLFLVLLLPLAFVLVFAFALPLPLT